MLPLILGNHFFSLLPEVMILTCIEAIFFLNMIYHITLYNRLSQLYTHFMCIGTLIFFNCVNIIEGIK